MSAQLTIPQMDAAIDAGMFAESSLVRLAFERRLLPKLRSLVMLSFEKKRGEYFVRKLWHWINEMETELSK